MVGHQVDLCKKLNPNLKSKEYKETSVKTIVQVRNGNLDKVQVEKSKERIYERDDSINKGK